MRIGIDIRCLAEGKTSGVEEYTIRTLRDLFTHDNRNKYILFFNSFRGSRVNLKWLEEFPHVELRDFRFPNKLLNFALWFFRFPKIDRLIGGVDIFFSPNIVFLALTGECKKVLTIHDLSFERFPETFSAKRRLWHFFINARQMIRSFDHVLAVSQSTKDDLVGLYGIDSRKISVSMPPLDFGNYQDFQISPDKEAFIRERYGLKKKYILYLGTIEPRKNIEGLISAYEALRDEGGYEGYQLVIAGAKGWKYRQIFQRLEQSRYRSDIHFTGFVKDKHKPLLYSLATVFVYPSFFEGFGFPPLEAMAAGTPTITSNCSSMPEVVGDAAILVDPYRPYEITLALKSLVGDAELRRMYQERGWRRIKELTGVSRTTILDLI